LGCFLKRAADHCRDKIAAVSSAGVVVFHGIYCRCGCISGRAESLIVWSFARKGSFGFGDAARPVLGTADAYVWVNYEPAIHPESHERHSETKIAGTSIEFFEPEFGILGKIGNANLA